jgi:hypothetical protein
MAKVYSDTLEKERPRAGSLRGVFLHRAPFYEMLNILTLKVPAGACTATDSPTR